jgi:nucleoside-diphosphate-sugar epimerase
LARVTRLPEQDLLQIVRATSELWTPLRSGRILVTGATGFFGVWLLESLLTVNRELGLGLQIFAQSRNPAGFLARMPHLVGASGIRWIQAAPDKLTAADIRDVDGAGCACLDAMVHLVTEADQAVTRERPEAATATIVGTTQRALDLARETEMRYFLYTSSGAVYARAWTGTPGRISEAHPLSVGVTDPAAGYAFSGGIKLKAEELCGIYHRQHGLNATIARCFTFIGPQMPLQGKFAMGNFLHDALHGRDIVIKGDGAPVRSYLYAADLTVWLWTILLRGVAGQPYNVGSEQAISLSDTAAVVRREVAPSARVKVLGQGQSGNPPDYYVPDTTRARKSLDLGESIPLDEAVRRTADWFRHCERR